MFTVTPIGSCRIATPLRLGQSTRGIRLNLNRSYGYCHSPAEAVQLARFLRGEVTIAADVWPLVSRSHRLETLSSETHVPSDLYVIELASAKELTIDGVSVQLNYLKSTYPDFFADPDRMQGFWDAAQTGDRARTTAFLDKAWSATDAQRADSVVLSRITLNYVTPDSLAQDIQTLGRLLPDVMFVSHVNARKPDGQTIKSRASFISLVSDGVRDAGFDLYDPTQLMAEFGQPAAIEDDSTSLAHFTTSFSTAVMDDWMARFIAPGRMRRLQAVQPPPRRCAPRSTRHARRDTTPMRQAGCRPFPARPKTTDPLGKRYTAPKKPRRPSSTRNCRPRQRLRPAHWTSRPPSNRRVDWACSRLP